MAEIIGLKEAKLLWAVGSLKPNLVRFEFWEEQSVDVPILQALHAGELVGALKEARCWIPDGSRKTPEERGAQCETAYDVEELIAKALRDAGVEV